MLVDWADLNNDNEIDYNELADALMCDDLLAFAALVPDKKGAAQQERSMTQVIGKRGVTFEALYACQMTLAGALAQAADPATVRGVMAYMSRGKGESSR